MSVDTIHRINRYNQSVLSILKKDPEVATVCAVRHMMFDPKARVIWFGTDTNNIGRVVVP